MKNYEFDYSKKQIAVSKGFLKEAGIIGSRAYNELAQVRRDYPGYSIVQREVNRKHEKKTVRQTDLQGYAGIYRGPGARRSCAFRAH